MSDNGKKDFRVTTYGEAKTGGGQFIEFKCRPEDVEKVKESLKDIKAIWEPVTGHVSVGHGGRGRYTRYDIEQHEYAGGGSDGVCGYIEVLQIKNPPDGRHGIVVHEYNTLMGSVFTEFRELRDALNAFKKNGASSNPKLEGFIRRVECGGLEPWFYAVGSQLLLGDFVFPDVITEDPIFRFGRRFVVRDRDGLPVIKTCMGMRKIKKRVGYYGDEKEKEYRVVYWDDGTIWDEHGSSQEPRPLDEKELWIQDALDQFKKALAGKITEFTIPFIDGSKFVGKLKLKNPKSKHAAGIYKVRVTYGTKSKKKKTTEGEFDFNPTPEIPTIEDSIRHQAENKGCKLISIDSIVKEKGRRYEGKWAGVYNPPESE